MSFRSTGGPDDATLRSSDIDRELRPVKYDQRHSEPHRGAPELAIRQFAGLPNAGPALSGLTVATNTAKHSAMMVNVTRLKTSFISFPIVAHLAPAETGLPADLVAAVAVAVLP